MEPSNSLSLFGESEALEVRRQARGTDPYRLGEASDALAELDTLAISSPEAFKTVIDHSTIEGVVDTLLAEIQRIKDTKQAHS